ncbi:hypothetical protein H6P81_021192 [Aristolochia fimbriata]|uniref:Uncharacterized protein n=1 Tax=Aristolochia fimbriata TaxID=158543 RepID=A0AAV7DS99_ARIFI|nr:hypothetical protein H6P81_021192 [Aristolochia fimbriata]
MPDLTHVRVEESVNEILRKYMASLESPRTRWPREWGAVQGKTEQERVGRRAEELGLAVVPCVESLATSTGPRRESTPDCVYYEAEASYVHCEGGGPGPWFDESYPKQATTSVGGQDCSEVLEHRCTQISEGRVDLGRRRKGYVRDAMNGRWVQDLEADLHMYRSHSHLSEVDKYLIALLEEFRSLDSDLQTSIRRRRENWRTKCMADIHIKKEKEKREGIEDGIEGAVVAIESEGTAHSKWQEQDISRMGFSQRCYISAVRTNPYS